MEKMIGGTHARFVVADSSHVGELRRAVRDLAQVIGFSSEAIGRAELVATELATNLTKHVANGGEVLLGSLTVDAARGLEMISLDTGAGMADPQLMLEDGVSTTGTMGGGLGAIKRLSDEFDIYSKPGDGTAILSRMWLDRKSIPVMSGGVEVGGVVIAKPGHDVSGDRWAARVSGGKTTIVLCDGLGHGHKAAAAAEECLRVFFDSSPALLTPADLLHNMHDAARHTQGAAVAVAQLDPGSNSVVFSGIGNVAARVYCPNEQKSCASMPGGVGFQMARVKEFTYPWAENAMLSMNSDGLLSSVNLGSSSSKHQLALIASIVYRDFRRGTDDASVVIARDTRAYRQ